jgi:hypothetical protein
LRADDNECDANSELCGPTAVGNCTNTLGGYSCSCKAGISGLEGGTGTTACRGGWEHV